MRVLWTVTYFSPYISGLTLCAYNLAKYLPGVKSSVLTNQHTTGLKELETVDGIEVIRAKTLVKISKGFVSVEWVSRLVDKLRECEVVVVHLPQPEALITAGLARVCNKPLVAIYHCELKYANKWAEAMVTLANMVALALAKAIVTYTSDYAVNSKLLKRHSGKVAAIYPPIPQTVEYKKKIRQKGKKIVLGMASRVAAEKGFEYVLEAMRKLAELGVRVELKVAGNTNPPGEEEYAKQIRAEAGKLGDRVEFVGQIASHKMNEFYTEIDMLIVPSTNSTEAFGIVQVEAMRCGVPVIASNMPGVRVPIQVTGMGELVEVGDVSGLTKAILKIDKQWGKYSQRRNLAEFEMQKSLDKYLSILRAAVA